MMNFSVKFGMTGYEKKSVILSFRVLLSFMSLQKTKQKLWRRAGDQRGRWPGKYSGNIDLGAAHTSLGQVYSCSWVSTLVGLMFLSIQHRGFSGNTGVEQVVRMSYLSCVGLLSLMCPLECVEKPCKRRPISTQMWGHRMVTRLWPALVSTRAWGGPRPGSAMYWEELGLWLSIVVGVTCLSFECLWKSEFLVQ